MLESCLSIIYLDDLKSREDNFYSNIKSVISIHNIEFQGKFNPYDQEMVRSVVQKRFVDKSLPFSQ